VEELIQDLRAEFTIVIVTHNMQQAVRVSDHTAFFNIADIGQPGHLIETGPTKEIFANPRDPQTRDYVMGRFG